jgi:hypothetical protein
MTTQAKSTRKNSETVHKPYRSNTSFYPDYREEVPDADYYGLKHSEFKKPWLPASGYDEMEYKFDFPLEYLNPNYIDIEVPDAWKYEFPNAPTVNPDWTPTRWNPQYPTPDFPKPKEYAKKKPGPNLGSKIVWLYCEGIDFTFCPGTTAQVQFVEYTTDPIVAIDTDLATLIRASFGRLGDSRHRPGYPEGTLTITIQIPESVNRDLNITATTESGETCVSRGTQSSSCLGCEGVSIGYTSTQMIVNSSQTLSVVNPVAGTEYMWKVVGGGTLTEQRGLSTGYIAPESNPDCTIQPTIYLKDYATGQVCASLNIDITVNESWVAYKMLNEPDTVYEAYCRLFGTATCATVWNSLEKWFSCSGELLNIINPGPLCLTDRGACSPPYPDCMITLNSDCNTMVDVRTTAQKEAGCCPSALL